MGRRGLAILLSGFIAAAGAADAADMSIVVLDRHNRPVPEVAVTLSAADGHVLAPMRPAAEAVMAQNHRAFIPALLVVGTRTAVSFPNNDMVSHQVYSFSKAKRFQLPLYKGRPKSPVLFDNEGLVVLGCNIHDEMVGYIFVTDAPRFGKTDAEGRVEFRSLPAGEYSLSAWGPFIADSPESLKRVLHLEAQGEATEQVKLSRPLRSRPSPSPGREKWDY
ncbi:MAG: hypothetical protein RLZZ200_1496 [Pseudomonadota bacterium]|jgi:plastocyanin